MKIYLDIDGVLLTKNGEPTIGLLKFLKKVTDNYECFWLTTHCQEGDLKYVKYHLENKLPQEAWQYVDKIKPTIWSYLKTEAIDFSSDFLWFDDNLMYAEKQVLSQQNAFNSFRLVELRKYLDQLRREVI